MKDLTRKANEQSIEAAKLSEEIAKTPPSPIEV